MKTINTKAQAEIEIKKSRFISIFCPAESQDEAKSILAEYRHSYPDATHIVYAFQLGKNADIFGLSDDGEPHGTAGRPVYEVLKGSGITNALLMVIRYFGGTKLGTGGLVKAYTLAAQEVVAASEPKDLIEKAEFELSLPYQFYDQVKIVLQEHSALIGSEDFSTDVHLKGSLPQKEIDRVKQKLLDLSGGALHLDIGS